MQVDYYYNDDSNQKHYNDCPQLKGCRPNLIEADLFHE